MSNTAGRMKDFLWDVFFSPPMIHSNSFPFVSCDMTPDWLREEMGASLWESRRKTPRQRTPSLQLTRWSWLHFHTFFVIAFYWRKHDVKTYHGKVCIAVNYIFLHTGHAMFFLFDNHGDDQHVTFGAFGAGSIWSCISSFLMPPSFSWFEAPKIRHAHPWWVSWLMMLEGGRWCCIQSLVA